MKAAVRFDTPARPDEATAYGGARPAEPEPETDGDDDTSIAAVNTSGDDSVRLALQRRYFNGTLCDGVCFRFSLEREL